MGSAGAVDQIPYSGSLQHSHRQGGVNYSQKQMPAKSRLGQNFLRDTRAIERIVAAVGDCAGRTIVEIGPGRGAITHALVARVAAAEPVGRVIAVELDRDLAAALRVDFLLENAANVNQPLLQVVEKSILDFDLTAAAEASGGPLLVVGNLPYYITSDILLQLGRHHRAIERAVLMVQREVAERVTAKPGGSDYGLLSATVQMYGPVEQLFTLPPSAFSPPPQVHSTVFRWTMSPRFEELGVEADAFFGFLRKCFAQKRKTLANNLRAAGYSTEQLTTALNSTGVNAHARAETLTLTEFAAIARNLSETA
jgi:16S rRNA (adenine1518-N6/adenine1519-N6)-dimethyltransferase